MYLQEYHKYFFIIFRKNLETSITLILYAILSEIDLKLKK